jgi:hypothetical protein
MLVLTNPRDNVVVTSSRIISPLIRSLLLLHQFYEPEQRFLDVLYPISASFMMKGAHDDSSIVSRDVSGHSLHLEPTNLSGTSSHIGASP